MFQSEEQIANYKGAKLDGTKPGDVIWVDRDHNGVIDDGEKGGDLAPENEIDCLPQAMVQDTALLDFINEVQMYYTGAQVSATARCV